MEPESRDPRVVDNLVGDNFMDFGFSPNEKGTGKMWLAPFINPSINDPKFNMNRQNNQLWIMFNQPVCVTGIAFWNYSKTPERGVQDYMLHCDGKHIYSVFQHFLAF